MLHFKVKSLTVKRITLTSETVKK